MSPARAQFLDPKVLARIDNLALLARTVVDGFLNGLHRAPYLGLSMDFAEHRAYVPGDDTRHLDWRLFARTDRHYVKQYEAETNIGSVVTYGCCHRRLFGSGGSEGNSDGSQSDRQVAPFHWGPNAGSAIICDRVVSRGSATDGRHSETASTIRGGL